MNRIKLREVVVVEGKYDKIRLESLLDAVIITTDGFGIFKNKEKTALLRKLADERGLLVMTDPDGAGLVIRGFLSGCVEQSKIRHVYVPQLAGKEKRKTVPSKEGLLGVEGLDTETLLEALRRAGITPEGLSDGGEAEKEPVTRERLFDDGFIGGEGSAERRRQLLRALGLPDNMSAPALLRVINIVTDIGEYERIAAQINDIS